jgi:hypothetical protein
MADRAHAVKPTPDEYRERLDFVEKLYLSGRNDRAIQHAAHVRFDVEKRAVRTWIAKVRKRLGNRFVRNPEAAAARAEAMALETFKLARDRVHVDRRTGAAHADPDTKTMALIALRLGEMLGAFAPKKIEHSGTVRTESTEAQKLHDEASAIVAAIAGEATAGNDREVAGGEAPNAGESDRAVETRH